MARLGGGAVARLSLLTRVGWGGTLLLAPRAVLRRFGRSSGLAVATLRILGARHLVQAAVLARHPVPAVFGLGAGVDGVHALTTAALAAVDRPQRRIALGDGAIAVALMTLDLWTARAPAAKGR
ncbi:hypothetical protein [Polymorphospora rubra]|uniref:hypothetical protein n=1 Tax=Polymorphospora rubra TaxID=338584 RepID=UPI0034094FBC